MGPSGEHRDSARTPFGSWDTDVFPIILKVQVDWWMRGQSREGSFGGIEDGGEVGAGLAQGLLLRGRQSRVDVNVQVRVPDCAHGEFGVALCPS